MEFQQKKDFCSQITYDKEIFLNKEIQEKYPLSNASKSYDRLINERSSTFPMNEFISKKKEIDLLYQHPDIYSKGSIKVRDEYHNLKVDFINKWYENYDFSSLIASSMAEQMHLNALKLPSDLDEELNLTKEAIKTQYNAIYFDSQIQINSVLIKTYLKNFVHALDCSLKDGLDYSEIISETLKVFLSRNNQLIFIIGNELASIINLVSKKFKENESKEDEQLTLLQILFNISFGFQSLYGFLVFVKLIQTSHLETKHVFNESSLHKLNDIVYQSHLVPLSGFTALCESSIDLDIEKIRELSFKKTSSALASADMLLMHNTKLGLIKLAIVQREKMSLHVVNSCKDKAFSTPSSLFVYDEVVGFLFSFQHFKAEEGLANLFTLFNVLTLKPFDSNQIHCSYDDLTKMILFSNEVDTLFRKHYIKYLLKEEEEELKEKTSLNVIYSSEVVAVSFEAHLLYIIHPIFNRQKVDKKQANGYIYALDVFDVSFLKKTNTFHFTHYQTLVFNWKSPDKAKPQVQDIFTKNITLNRFIVVNGQLITPDGHHILNSRTERGKASSALVEPQIAIPHKENGLMMSHKGNAMFIYPSEDKEEKRDNQCAVFIHYYRLSAYQMTNELLPTRRLIQFNSRMQEEVVNDSFDDLFMVNVFNQKPQAEKKTSQSPSQIKQSETSTQMILQTICDCIDYRQYMSVNSNKIEHWIKAPYILSLDCFSIGIILDLMKENFQNEYIFKLIAKIFSNQICQMINNKASTLLFFNTPESTEHFLSQFLQMQQKASSTQTKSILSIFLMRLLKISTISSEKFNGIIISIMPVITESSIEFIIANEDIINEFISLMIYTKDHLKRIASNQQLFAYLTQLVSILLKEEQQRAFSPNYLSIAHSLAKDIFTVFSLLLSDPLLSEQLSQLTHLIFIHIKSNISLLVKQAYSFSLSLFHFVLMIILSNYSSLSNSFIFKSISVLIEVVISLSSLKPPIHIDPSLCLDVIFDNFSSFEEKNKLITFKYPSAYQAMDTSASLPNKVYIKVLVNRKEHLKDKVRALELICKKSNKVLHTIYVDDRSSSSTYCFEADLFSGIELLFNSELASTLTKIRVSNYEFFLEDVDYLLQPSVEVVNSMLKHLMFYSNYINADTQLYDLFSTRLFSQGIINARSKSKENGEVETFIQSIEETSEYYAKYLSESFGHLKEDSLPVLTIEEDASKAKDIHLDELEMNEDYNAFLNQFNLQLNVIIKGDIPDRIVKSAYYIILRHENILDEMLPVNREVSRKTLFLIWKECSNLRKAYKEIKDTFIQQNQDITQGFNKIFSKMSFLFHLQPERKESLIQTNIRKRKDSLTSASLPCTEIIKDHLNNISQIIKNTVFTIDNIKKGYEEVNTKAKFREIAIKLLIDLLQRLNDREVTCNLLTYFYSNFISGNKSYPSIYEGLKSINERTVENITQAFHDLLNVILTKLDSSKSTKFEQCILLNCLIWKIRKRDFPFIENSQLLHLLENEEQLLNANQFLYFILPTKKSNSCCLYANYSELRPIDDCHLGKLLTDIFAYYSQRIIKLEINSSQETALHTSIPDELKLSRMKSYNKQEAFQSIVETIIEVYERQFEKTLGIFKTIESEQLKSTKTPDLIFPIEPKQIQTISKETIQLKLNNLLNSLNKSIILKGHFFFNYHSLWSVIVSLLKYADYHSSRLIYALIECFSLAQQDNMSQFYNKLTLSNITVEEYSNSLLFDYLFNVTNYKDLTHAYLQFWLKNINESEVISYANRKIANDSAFNMLDVFYCSVSNLTSFSKVLVNTSLGIEGKEIFQHKSNEKDRELFLKKGYSLIDSPSLQLDTQDNKGDSLKEEAKTEDDEEEEENDERNNNDSYSDGEDNERSNSSANKPSNEIAHLNLFKTPLIRNHSVLLNEFDETRLNSINVNENEILTIEDNSYIFPIELIKKSIDYLSVNLMTKNDTSFNQMMNYLRILKCLTKSSYQDTGDSKDLIRKFVEESKGYIASLMNTVRFPLNFSVLSPLKVEAYLNSVFAVSSEEERSKMIEDEMRNSINVERAFCCKALINDNRDMISFFIEDDIANKINVPVCDTSNLESFETKACLDLCVLNIEDYEKICAYYQEIISNQEFEKEEDEKEEKEQKSQDKKKNDKKKKKEKKKKKKKEDEEEEDDEEDEDEEDGLSKEKKKKEEEEEEWEEVEDDEEDCKEENTKEKDTKKKEDEEEWKEVEEEKEKEKEKKKKKEKKEKDKNKKDKTVDKAESKANYSSENQKKIDIDVRLDSSEAKPDQPQTSENKEEKLQEPQKPKMEKKALRTNSLLFLSLELINLLGVNQNHQIGDQNYIIEKEKDKKKKDDENPAKDKEEQDAKTIKSPNEEKNEAEQKDNKSEEVIKPKEDESKEIPQEEKDEEEEKNNDNEAQVMIKEDKDEEKEKEKEGLEESKDKESENDALLGDMFDLGDTIPKKEIKKEVIIKRNIFEKRQEPFTTPAWELFTKALLYTFNITNCAFLIENTLYNKIPKNFQSYAYSSTFLPSEFLKATPSLQSYLKEKIIQSKSNNTSSTLFQQVESTLPTKTLFKRFNLSKDLANKYISPDEKEEKGKAKNKDKKSLIELKKRFISPGISFKDLYQTFPSIALKTKPSLNTITSIGYSLIKYYFLHLQLVNSLLSDISGFQYLFNTAYYYKECFNLNEDYEKMLQLLPDIISAIPLKSFLKDKDIICLSYLSSNELFNSSILDVFLSELIKLFGKQNDEEKLLILFTFIIERCTYDLKSHHLENTLIAFKLLLEVLNYIKSERNIEEFIHSLLIESLKKSFSTSKHSFQQYYLIKVIEFLYQVKLILKNNGLIKDDDKEAFYNKTVFKNIDNHIDIINNKFKSEMLLKALITEQAEFKEKMTTTLLLPFEPGVYAFKLKAKQCSVTLSKEDWKDSYIYIAETSSSSQNIKYPSTNTLKDSSMKDSMIIKQEVQTNVSSVLYTIKDSKIKQMNSVLLQGSKDAILFMSLYQLNSSLIVGKDKYDNYYYCGEYGKGNKTKANVFLPFDDLNAINKQAKYISQIDSSMIITDDAVYFLKSISSPPKWLTSHNSRLFKFSLSINAKFIGGHFAYDRFLLWTEDGKLFGIGSNSYHELIVSDSQNLQYLKEIEKPAHLKVLNAYSFVSFILVFALDTNTRKKNIYMSGCNYGFKSTMENDYNWFIEVKEINDEGVLRVEMNEKKIVFLTQSNVYVLFENSSSNDSFQKVDCTKTEANGIEDIWLSGSHLIMKCKLKENWNKGNVGFVIARKTNLKLLLNCEEMENEINFNMRPFVVMGKKIIIAHHIQAPFLPEDNVFIQNEEKKSSMKFAITMREEKKQYTAQLYNSNTERGIYVFDIMADDISQAIEEDEEIISTASSQGNHSITSSYDKICSIKDISTSQSLNNRILMHYLAKFAHSIKHLSQITLFCPETPTLLTNTSYINLSLISLTNLNDLNSTSIPQEIKAIVKAERSNLTEQFAEVKQNVITEFLKSKDSFSNLKDSTMTFVEYMKSKYANYGQFSQLSSERFLNQMEFIVNQFQISIRYLMDKVNCLHDSFIASLVLSNLSIIPLSEQTNIINSFFDKLKRNDRYQKVNISRGKVLTNRSQGLKDVDYTWSYFCQLYEEMKKNSSSFYFKKINSVLVEVDFIGEHGTDAGGLARELIDLVFSDLSSDSLNLFIPTPNNSSNSGNDRDKYKINPKCIGARCLELYTFLGKLMIYIISNQCYVPLPLPSFIWKQILEIPLTPIDIEGMDVHAYNSIIKVLQSGTYEERKALYEVLNFTCQLSDEQVVDLVPNGEKIKVNESNAELFLSLYLRVRYNECYEQSQAIRKGLLSYIPSNVLKCLSWEKLEEMICGQGSFDIELLKRHTVYDPPYHSEDKTITFFWKFLEECTLEEKYLYIKFIWGRSRLPKVFNADQHTIQKMSVSAHEVNLKLPVGHTCSFSIDLPPYTSYNVLKEKMMYAIKNAMIISDSSNDLTFLS